MAFSVYEVVRVACQSRSWFVYALGCKKPTTQLTSDEVRKPSNPCKGETSVHTE